MRQSGQLCECHSWICHFKTSYLLLRACLSGTNSVCKGDKDSFTNKTKIKRPKLLFLYPFWFTCCSFSSVTVFSRAPEGLCLILSHFKTLKHSKCCKMYKSPLYFTSFTHEHWLHILYAFPTYRTKWICWELFSAVTKLESTNYFYCTIKLDSNTI